MSRLIRLEDADQTTVILVEDDYVAVQGFFGDPRNEDLDHPDSVMIYAPWELAWLIQALTQASAFLAGLNADFFSCMRGECDESCAFRPACGNGPSGAVEGGLG